MESLISQAVVYCDAQMCKKYEVKASLSLALNWPELQRPPAGPAHFSTVLKLDSTCCLPRIIVLPPFVVFCCRLITFLALLATMHSFF